MAIVASFKVEGLAELEKQLKELEPKVAKKIARKAMKDAAQVVAEKAKELAPVDTGTLRDSIRVKSGRGRKGRVSIQIATSATDNAYSGKSFYAPMIEFGTSKQEAKPFLRPALESTKEQCVDIIKQGIIQALKEIESKG